MAIFINLEFQVREEDLENVAEISGVMDAPDDYIPSSLQRGLNRLLPNSENIRCNEFVQKYIMQKERYQDSSNNSTI